MRISWVQVRESLGSLRSQEEQAGRTWILFFRAKDFHLFNLSHFELLINLMPVNLPCRLIAAIACCRRFSARRAFTGMRVADRRLAEGKACRGNQGGSKQWRHVHNLTTSFHLLFSFSVFMYERNGSIVVSSAFLEQLWLTCILNRVPFSFVS